MENKIPIELRIISVIVLVLGAGMLVYWGMYVFQVWPISGIPILSELISAALALISGIGLLRLRNWSRPTSLFTAGMWAYGVLGGLAWCWRTAWFSLFPLVLSPMLFFSPWY